MVSVCPLWTGHIRGTTLFRFYFTTGGLSNGPTEAMDLLIKKIKRVGHGFRSGHVTSANEGSPTRHSS